MNKLLTALALLAVSFGSGAQTEVPHEFEAGQPARAAEVNANFNALGDAIDANATAIGDNTAAIEANAAAIAALPGTGAIVLDLSDAADCVVDTPGYYILNRSWLLTPAGTSEPPYGCQLQIATDATLDFRGFTIDVGDSWPGDMPAITVSAGATLAISNGAIRSEDVAISAPEANLVVTTMRLTGLVDFSGGSIRNSSIANFKGDVNAIRVRGNGVIRDSDVRCVVPCIESGPGGTVEVFNNTISGDLYPTVVVTGPGNLIRNNRITGSVLLTGSADNSIVAWNTFDGNMDVEVSGVVIDSNIGSGDMNFSASGNFYGGNRLSGQFNGTAGQTDWGGNVIF